MSTMIQQPASAKSIREVVLRLLDSGQCELPALPEVAAQLIRLTNDADCEITEIVGLIRRDQSLTSHLLRIANSIRYSSGVSVSSIQQAVARLGLLCVREIVVLISCQCRIFDVAEFEKDVRASFRRSMAAAAICQEIARVRRLNVEEAFLSGLLHDVGRPILLQFLSDIRRKETLAADDEELRDAASIHRIPIGARLIRSWELSDRVAEAVLYQESPILAPLCGQQAAMLCLALELSRQMLGESPAAKETCDITADKISPDLLAMLNLYPEQLAQIIRKQPEIMEWVTSST